MTLIYGVRTLADVIFRDELEALAARHRDFRLHLLPTVPDDRGVGADDRVTVTFARTGRTVAAHRGDGLIRIAEANGIAIDYSCRNGECGSCRCRLIEGEVSVPDETALTAGERTDGLVLACVARPATDAITLDL